MTIYTTHHIPSGASALLVNQEEGERSSYSVVMTGETKDILFMGPDGKTLLEGIETPDCVFLIRPGIDSKSGDGSGKAMLFVYRDGEIGPFPGGNVFMSGDICPGDSYVVTDAAALVNHFWSSPFNTDLVEVGSVPSMEEWMKMPEGGKAIRNPMAGDWAWHVSNESSCLLSKEMRRWRRVIRKYEDLYDDLQARMDSTRSKMKILEKGVLNNYMGDHRPWMALNKRVAVLEISRDRFSSRRQRLQTRCDNLEAHMANYRASWVSYYRWRYESSAWANRNQADHGLPTMKLWLRAMDLSYGAIHADGLRRGLRPPTHIAKECSLIMGQIRRSSRLKSALASIVFNKPYRLWSHAWRKLRVMDWWREQTWRQNVDYRAIEKEMGEGTKMMPVVPHALLCVHGESGGDYIKNVEMDGIERVLDPYLDAHRKPVSQPFDPGYCAECDNSPDEMYRTTTEEGDTAYQCPECEYYNDPVWRMVETLSLMLPMFIGDMGRLVVWDDKMFMCANDSNDWTEINKEEETLELSSERTD